MNKRYLTRGLAALLALSLLAQPLPAAARQRAYEPEGMETAETTEDTEERILEIATAEELIALAEECHTDTFSTGLEVVLTADISLVGAEFNSINIFNGHFDGQGHTISGYRYGGDGYVTGFFRYLSKDAVVERLTLSLAVTAEGDQTVTGGIAGINHGTIRDCSVRGRIKGKTDTGGIVGINEADGSVSDCVNEAGISGYYYTGGIAGKNFGLISGCENTGNINDSVEWVETDDEMGGDILSELTDTESTAQVRLRSGIDTGGIAGYSKGVILSCKNEATIGYEHAGYNVGGIAGRQNGSMNGCVNNGDIYGRKDVGGVVGQMEPYLELDNAASISEAIEELHDLVNVTLNDMDSNNDRLRADMDDLQYYADAAMDTGAAMNDSATDYINTNTDVINDASGRMSDVADMMPKVVDNVSEAGDQAQVLTDTLRELNDDLYISGQMSEEDKDKADGYVRTIDESSRDMVDAAEALEQDTQGLRDMAASEDYGKYDGTSYYVSYGSALYQGSITNDHFTSTRTDRVYRFAREDNGESEGTSYALASYQGTPIGLAMGNGVFSAWYDPNSKIFYYYDVENGADLSNGTTAEVKQVTDGSHVQLVATQTYSVDDYVTEGEPAATDLYICLSEAADITTAISGLYGIYSDYIEDAADDSHKDIEDAMDEMDRTMRALDRAQEGVSDITAYLNAQSDLALVQIDRTWDDQVDQLHGQLDGMSDTIGRLSDHAGDYSSEVNDHLRAINDQINKIYELADDRLVELTDNGFEDVYSDVSDLNILTATLGKVASCVNYGEVRGDINIGGITGAMAVDEEDPESNAAGTVEFSFGDKYTSQNILHNCTNRGYITAKGDGAGGIVGYMAHGVVNKSYAYGVIESTGGNYVGGVAGQSLSILRGCYVLCALSGGEYVGGVAGYGETITDCCAMPTIVDYRGKCGAIAGQIEIDRDTEEPHLDSLENNRYVSDTLYGIDAISYGGAAEAIRYDELLRMPGTPIEYRYLTVTFRVEDEYLSAQQIRYGDSYDTIEFPQIPARQGYYGEWPELGEGTVQGNLVITGEYVDAVTVLASGNVDTESGRVLGYVDSEFNDAAGLIVQQTHDISMPADPLATEYVVYRAQLVDMERGGNAAYRLRLYNPYTGGHKVWYYDGSVWSEAEYLDRGSYVEVTMQGLSGTYAISKDPSGLPLLILAGSLVAVAILLIILLVRLRRRRRAKRGVEAPDTVSETEE